MARLVLSYKHVITSYGAKTLSGHGGIAVPAGAASITDAGGTNLTISSGFVVPASNGVSAGIVTFDNGVTWEIRPVANAYSVRTHAQLLVTMRLTALAYGDRVLLRGGAYDDTETNLGSARIRRDAPPVGTFVAPSRHGAPGTSDWYRGPNLDTGNYILVQPHADTPFTETVGAGRSRTITAKTADSPTLGMIDVDGDGVNERGFRFHGLRFAGRKGLIFRGACLDMAADRCHFENEDPIPSWDTWSGSTPPEFGAHRIYVLNGGCTNIAVLDNLIEGGGYGVRLAGTNDGYAVVGNWARGMWIDSFQMGAGANTLIAWNISDDKKDGPTEATLHGDHFQWNNYGDDTVVVGNISWRGDGYTARPDGQGIFLSDAPSARSGLAIAGNVSATSFVRGISLDLGDDPAIVGNMALDPLPASTLATVIWNADAKNSGGWIAGNIGEAISANSTATLSGNVTLPSTTYADVFVDPDFALDPWVNMAAWLAGFTTKAGGPLDITPTKNPIGASWINYATRTFDPAILERGSVEDAIIISDPVPVLSDFGAGSIDDLELDPPAIFIEHNIGGTLTGDFHSSATPPAKEAGDIGFFTTSLSGEAVTDISTALNTFLDLHPGETGYLHFRLTAGTDSNVITTQQITTPTAFSLIDDGWTGSQATLSDNVITANAASGNVFPEARKLPYNIPGADSYRITVDASEGTLRYLVVSALLFDTNADFTDVYDLQAGTVTRNAANSSVTSITSLGGGRYRCISEFTADGTDLSGRISIGISELSTVHRVIDPDGTETINIHNITVEAI